MAKHAAHQSKTSKYGPPPPQSAMEEAGHEMKMNPPGAMQKAMREGGKAHAESVRRAIMFSKARRAAKK